jgi:serine/threonine-protein kinase
MESRLSRPAFIIPAPGKSLRVGSRLGKFRLDRRIGSGAYATVYAATDTLLGLKVALKVPADKVMSSELLDAFRREVRLTLKLDHPNVLPIRDATFIDGHLVIVTPLAERTLFDRLQSRMGFDTAYDVVLQLLEGVAHAHQQRVVHCDIKPENILLFPGNRLRLADFGIAKAAHKTINGLGTGTVGYMAPEQAMGRPSTRSDVFSIGVIAFRLFSGYWPQYPFEWPMPGSTTLRRRAHPEMVAIIRKSLSVKPSQRYRDAEAMLADWKRVRIKATRFARRHRSDTSQ